jgi:hypothetical protein
LKQINLSSLNSGEIDALDPLAFAALATPLSLFDLWQADHVWHE